MSTSTADKKQPNFANRTLFTADNLDILRGIDDEVIDLIYLDPPFNSNDDYAGLVDTQSGDKVLAKFKDTWTLDDVKAEWPDEIEAENPRLWHAVVGAGETAGDSMQAFLTIMAVRLVEMHRILKPTGSIYLHCDDSAGAYLEQLMDAVFGRNRRLNTITWKRTSSRSDAKRFGRVSDRLLFYSKTDNHTWNQQYTPHNPKHVSSKYRYDDGDGRGLYRRADLTAAGTRAGESGEPWRNIDPTVKGNHWRTPTQGGMNKYIIDHKIIDGWPDAYPGVQARLDALDEAGLIHWPDKPGGIPQLKRYLASTEGNAAADIIDDIPPVNPQAKEKTGYPTQKPLDLLRRLIRASSNPGDLVLDPFCGCATACVAAELEGRRWAGIDVGESAVDLVKLRLERQVEDGALLKPEVHDLADLVVHSRKPPKRTDPDRPEQTPARFLKPKLYDRQNGRCNGPCGGDNEGRELPMDLLDIDHIQPKSKGGTDTDENKQLLCRTCNATKGNRTMTYLKERQAEIDATT